MTMENDEQLLNELARLFASESAHLPSDEEVAAFRAVVDAQRAAMDESASNAPAASADDHAAAPATGEPVEHMRSVASRGDEGGDDGVVVPFARPARRWARRLAIGSAAVVVGVSGVTAVAAAANNGVLPKPARLVAHAVGLPVDSVELAAAKHALHELRKADDAALNAAIERVEKALDGLSPSERSDVVERADSELRDANERVSRRGRGGGDSASSGNGSGTSGGGTSNLGRGSGESSGGSSGGTDRGGRGGGDDSVSSTSVSGAPIGATTATSEDRGGHEGGDDSGQGGASNSGQSGSGGGSGSGDGGQSGSGGGGGSGSGSGSGGEGSGGGSGSGSGGSGSGSGGGSDDSQHTPPSTGAVAPPTTENEDHSGKTATTRAATPTTPTTEDGHKGGGGSGSGGSGKP